MNWKQSSAAKGPRRWKTERFLAIGNGDLLSGAKNSYIATLVERSSRFAILIKVPRKDTEVVVAALSRHVRKLAGMVRSEEYSPFWFI
jgi:IS30 family transposase